MFSSQVGVRYKTGEGKGTMRRRRARRMSRAMRTRRRAPRRKLDVREGEGRARRWESGESPKLWFVC